MIFKLNIKIQRNFISSAYTNAKIHTQTYSPKEETKLFLEGRLLNKTLHRTNSGESM